MRVLKNASERAFQEYAEQQGWEVSKRGWPDFIVAVGDDEYMAVEVKLQSNHHPKKEQSKVHRWLKDHGIVTVVWSPDTGFREK